MGVSGKGLVVIDNKAKFQRLVAMLKRSATEGARLAFVMEVWVEKLKDINYQIFITRSGEVTLLALKEILAEGGVHLGHRFPADLTQQQWSSYQEAAQAVGKRLFEDGFTGIAGIDSIIDGNGSVYPVLEINGRFNMSTYQIGLERLIGSDACVIAKHYALHLTRRLSFSEIRNAIGADLYRPASVATGIIIQNFATVNANCDSATGGQFKGRLYALLVGRDFDQLREMDQRIGGALNAIQAHAIGSAV